MSRPYGLGYVVVETEAAAAEAWGAFAGEILGLMVTPDPGGRFTHLRMDERASRIAIIPSIAERAIYGWEYASEQAWETAAARLEGADVKLVSITEPDALAARGVPLVSPLGVSFVTDDGGMGHVTLFVPDVAAEVAFYRDALGLELREDKWNGGLAFFGCNPRHHSLGLVAMPGDAAALAHIMVEVSSLDDVGRAMDRCLEGKAQMTVSLGKHWNDHMTSFYLKSPSGFEIEYGYGGRRVPDGTWTQVRQAGVGGASYWGHRVVLPDGSLGPNVGNLL
jgi:3,4-dihydroxy-9,10-secoandrosta-1,3,5(10)-triene-9,17-dione 4,5-dioxygenase